MSVADVPIPDALREPQDLSLPDPPTQESATARSPRPDGDVLARNLVAVARGDQQAFSELYRATSSHVFALAIGVLRQRAQADEVTQEVYLQVWEQADRFDPRRGTARAWVLTIAHRRAVDRVRRTVAARGRDHDHYVHEREREIDQVWDEVSARHEAAAVHAALERLSEKQRQAVILAHLGGHSATEIAAALGLATGTVKTRIRDGLINLRRTLLVP